ncbi:MAG: hypothetical protein IJ060_08280 [Oscillospiraceae bacterium]|nr:hypothetical protein [Oscillospiraceae bacterium]
MQRTYFLGGSSASGFETAFWQEHAQDYGFYLKGGPGTGKSTLMKKIAAAFGEESVSVYHCASDPHSLDAVVLEERGIFIADATAPHESSTPLPFVSGETVDLAEGLHADKLRQSAGEISALYRDNQAAHAQAKKGYGGITAMQDTVAGIGKNALIVEKLTGYAGRLAKRLLPHKSGTERRPTERQCCAVTPQGRLTLLPEEFDLILLRDDALAASQMLLTLLGGHAMRCGEPCEITRSLTQTARPVTHLLLPAQRIAVVSEPAIAPGSTKKPVTTINMQRFYRPELLRQQRELLRFCTKTAVSVEARTVEILADALRIHDELETYYIRALSRPFLDKKAAETVKRILAYAKS